MSYLQNQINSFNSNVVAAAKRMPTDRRFAKDKQQAQSSAAASASSATATAASKGRQNDPSAYSQPLSSSAGTNRMVQVTFAIEYLKTKGVPLTFADISSYLSLEQQGYDEQHLRIVERILQTHPKIKYDPSGADGRGTLSFKPPHNIRTADELLRKLQAQPTGQGMSVAELREGWPGVVAEINRLEKEGKLLVTRNKKEDFPKMVWPNDPSLIIHFDPEFKQIWEKTKIPDPDTVIEELEKAGITPTNKNKVVKAKPQFERKKTKRTRRGGKVTNTHMAGILRDYSHLQP
ncbi:transcription initiation factor IIE subunit beta [Ascosphaera apis ARSEF 7405]|uniref:Transcription initiation factor IIE subunit beta n=1 Tax=Ascosphaera apis ARSEF 7405 TaxID=392613 RepID=A0A167ZRQ2_9EURO|nr:transcription initiation factor IIE subunit beta [Ascosphaera apis ARSEF 7405]